MVHDMIAKYTKSVQLQQFRDGMIMHLIIIDVNK